MCIRDSAIDLDRPAGRFLQEVGTAQERALAGSRPADEADGLAGVDLHRAAAQDVVGAEVFFDLEKAHDRPRVLRGQRAGRGKGIPDVVRHRGVAGAGHRGLLRSAGRSRPSASPGGPGRATARSVSYTHLTLPTIYSV